MTDRLIIKLTVGEATKTATCWIDDDTADNPESIGKTLAIIADQLTQRYHNKDPEVLSRIAMKFVNEVIVEMLGGEVHAGVIEKTSIQ